MSVVAWRRPDAYENNEQADGRIRSDRSASLLSTLLLGSFPLNVILFPTQIHVESWRQARRPHHTELCSLHFFAVLSTTLTVGVGWPSGSNSNARIMAGLRSYVRQNVAHLRSSPCLLISSEPPPAVSTAVAGTKTPSSISPDEEARKARGAQLKMSQAQDVPGVRSFVERNAQSLSLEFNLRTVPCRISSAFPTPGGVREAVSLAKRAGLKAGSGGSGVGVVIGLGSGNAMDLAKAVADALFGDVTPCDGGSGSDGGGGSLVLAPCTLGGLWAASSNSPSVLLDTKEEMLLPHLTPSWSGGGDVVRRKGTVVALDAPRLLAMPPLYTAFQPVKRSEYSSAPSMAHVAAAAIAVVLDAARSLDAATKGTTGDNLGLHQNLETEMKAVASSCASVLKLAAEEAKKGGDDESSGENTKLAQQHLLEAIPRLSPIVEMSSVLANAPIATTGTLPQRMANALIPAYFPQCHLVTYLACILPGLCDVLSVSASSNEGNSMVGAVANALIESEATGGSAQVPSLSSWSSKVAAEAGLPSMASLAYGTPDMKALVGSLDSYEALMASLDGAPSIRSGQGDHWVMEDVLERSLHR